MKAILTLDGRFFCSPPQARIKGVFPPNKTFRLSRQHRVSFLQVRTTEWL